MSVYRKAVIFIISLDKLSILHMYINILITFLFFNSCYYYMNNQLLTMIVWKRLLKILLLILETNILVLQAYPYSSVPQQLSQGVDSSRYLKILGTCCQFHIFMSNQYLIRDVITFSFETFTGNHFRLG